MAGTAAHIAVADKMYSVLGNGKIKNIPLFFSGNIAPDAIHAKQGYQRADKKHTHLTEGISGSDFQDTEKIKIFHERVNEFIENYFQHSGEHKDLYLGYIVHLLTDELFNITVRKRFVSAMEKDGVSQSEKEFHNRVVNDLVSVDHILVEKYAYKQNIVDILESVWNYEIRDYVGQTEINRSKRWVIDSFFKGNHPQTAPLYYSYNDAVDFINFAASNIIELLSGGSDLIRVL